MDSTILLPLLTAGDIFMVDNTNKANITYVRGERHDLLFKIKCFVGRNEEIHVSQNQCRVVPICDPTPSIQGKQLQLEFTQVQAHTTPPPPQDTRNHHLQRHSHVQIVQYTILNSMDWMYDGEQTINYHPLLTYMKKRDQKEKG